jgi:uncharacterized protein YxeA
MFKILIISLLVIVAGCHKNDNQKSNGIALTTSGNYCLDEEQSEKMFPGGKYTFETYDKDGKAIKSTK